MDFTVRKLKIFVAVAQLGSFTEAAKLFHLTSAGLSLTVKTLEEEVGFKLFDRSTRSVRLTPAGLALLPFVDQLIADHQNLVQATRSILQKNAGVVRVAATQAISCTLLPPLNTQFSMAWPNISVIPVDAMFHRVQELLLRGEAEIGIGPDAPCDDDIVATELFPTRLYLCCSIHHAKARQPTVSWAELKGDKAIVVDASSPTVWARDSQYQVFFEKAISVGHVTTALALINEQAGIMICTNYVRQLTRAYDLAWVPLVDPVSIRNIMLFRNRRFAVSPATQRYIDYASSVLPKHPCAIDADSTANPN